MDIDISARHGQLGSETQSKISDKVGKLPRFFDKLTAIHVIVDLKNEESVEVEIRVSAEHTDNFVATSDGDSVMTAVDGSLHKIEQQIRKHKEKTTDRRATGHKHMELPSDSSDDGVDEDDE
ncbi:MAG: putative sigma-54 modulation protein [Pirellulaceae bacterium]